jgi:hypothetical protein
LAPSKLRQ